MQIKPWIARGEKLSEKGGKHREGGQYVAGNVWVVYHVWGVVHIFLRGDPDNRSGYGVNRSLILLMRLFRLQRHTDHESIVVAGCFGTMRNVDGSGVNTGFEQ